MEPQDTLTNILLLNKSFNPYGGISRTFVCLAKATSYYPLRLHFGAFEQIDLQIRNELEQNNHRVTVFCNKKTGGFDVVLRLRKYIKENNILVIYATCFRSFIVAKLATLFSRRVVFWAHSILELVI